MKLGFQRVRISAPMQNIKTINAICFLQILVLNISFLYDLESKSFLIETGIGYFLFHIEKCVNYLRSLFCGNFDMDGIIGPRVN